MSGHRRFAAFLLVGGLAAVVNVATRALVSLVAPFGVAIASAFLVALFVAFTLNRIYVFQSAGSRTHEFGKFLVVNLAALLQIWAVSMLLARFVLPWIGESWDPELVAHTVGVLSPVATSYVAHKRFTFARA